MEVIRTILGLRMALNDLFELRLNAGQQAAVGYVPTMGYLHEGHMSLIEAAQKQCPIIVLSIFVNPMQFGPNEDYEKYPRDTKRDLAFAQQAGVDIVFLPEVSEIYPEYPLISKVSISRITDKLCGASRPGHFDGVATIVLKLLNIVKPDFIYFGLKDAQQVAVIQQMVLDFNVDVEIVACTTFREPDGLAMSSRNVYLNQQERTEAVVLNRALVLAQSIWSENSEITCDELVILIKETIRTSSSSQIEYVEILAYPSLEDLPTGTPIKMINSEIIIALAVRFGKTRLIDNAIIPLDRRKQVCSEK